MEKKLLNGAIDERGEASRSSYEISGSEFGGGGVVVTNRWRELWCIAFGNGQQLPRLNRQQSLKGGR